MILPAKFEHERITFTVDFGDKLPWGSVIDAATILVEVSSGVDSNPYNVFSQILDVDETKVTFQVRAGLPGVIYKLICGVRVSGDWTYFDLKLAISPDQGDVGAVYPMTRIFTSALYPIYTEEFVSYNPELIGGELRGILVIAECQESFSSYEPALVGGYLGAKIISFLANEYVQYNPSLESGVLKSPIVTIGPGNLGQLNLEKISYTPGLDGGMIKTVLITYSNGGEKISYTPGLDGGTLA